MPLIAALPKEPAPDRLSLESTTHTRVLVERHGHFHAVCSCGWVIYGCLSPREAMGWPCEVQELLRIGAERRRHLELTV